MRKKILLFLMVFLFVNLSDSFHFLWLEPSAGPSSAEEYQSRLEACETIGDIAANGFTVIEDHRYDFAHDTLGTLEFIPAMDETLNRLVLFFADESGRLVLITDKLESNQWVEDSLVQTTDHLIGVAFYDQNQDGLQDITIVVGCRNTDGEYSNYNLADVLFQSESGFYRDWRISDKINRFDMNKDIYSVTAFVRDGKSTEYLYTARTLDGLLEGGFQVIEYHSFAVNFENFGVVDVKAGFYNMSGQNYLMLYIIDENGKIVWNFQPMHDYVNFYSIMGISFSDLNGDGLKDVLLLANFVEVSAEGETIIKPDFCVYYQMAGYFVEDQSMRESIAVDEDDSLETISSQIRTLWGW